MKKFATVQIILGILVVSSLFAWIAWVSSGYHIPEGIIPGSDTVIRSMGLHKPKPSLGIWAGV